MKPKGCTIAIRRVIVTRDLSLKLEDGARHELTERTVAGTTTVINSPAGVSSPMTGAFTALG